MFKGFSTGIKCFFKAIPFIFKNGLWWTLLIPFAVSIILFISGNMAFDSLFETYIQPWIEEKTTFEKATWVSGVLSGIAGFLFKIVYFFIFAFLNGYIILVVLSPLFAWISEKTEKILTNADYPFQWKQFIYDIWRGIAIATRNLFFELGVTLLVLIITLIPVLGWLAGLLSPIFLFLLTSYFYGFSFIDYNSERKKLRIKDSITVLRRNRSFTIATGVMFYICFIIPGIGSLLAGFVAIVSTVGAAMGVYELGIYNKEIKN